MKTRFAVLSLVASAAIVQAADKVPKDLPPPVYLAPSRGQSGEVFVYHQQPVAGQPFLIPPEQAQAIIERFREGYKKMGSPRILIYVNRELVDEKSGLRLSSRTEKTHLTKGEVTTDFPPASSKDSPGKTNKISVTTDGGVTIGPLDVPAGKGTVTYSTEKSTADAKFRHQGKTELTLADKQTIRDVERLFGRPLRHGGAALADQRVATQLIGDRPLENLTISTGTEQARKDREALSRIADVVLEVLISSRTITVQEVSGDKTHQVPDIQATAIRLSDSRILGQATASDILGKDRFAGRVARQFDARDIAEATALTLMDDMMVGMQP